jgi:hypothetical protein
VIVQAALDCSQIIYDYTKDLIKKNPIAEVTHHSRVRRIAMNKYSG